MPEPLTNYGGQAVIEGVMMRGSRACAVAVRAPDHSIELKTEPLARLYRTRWIQVPFVRGLFILWDALVLGFQALTFSANVQTGEEEQLEGPSVVLSLILSLLIGLAFFFLLPAGFAYLAELVLGWSHFWVNLFEGFIRLSLLIAYIWAIGRIPEIHRVYGYHGAEHKTINAFEDGAPLEVDSIAKYPRENPRCGTAFLLTVVVFSIIFFSLLGPMPLIPRLLSRILLIPVIAGFAYEYIRLTSKWLNSPWVRPLVLPNLWLQRLTTREPDPEMIEVAIQAFQSMRSLESSTTNPT